MWRMTQWSCEASKCLACGKPPKSPALSVIYGASETVEFLLMEAFLPDLQSELWTWLEEQTLFSNHHYFCWKQHKEQESAQTSGSTSKALSSGLQRLYSSTDVLSTWGRNEMVSVAVASTKRNATLWKLKWRSKFGESCCSNWKIDKKADAQDLAQIQVCEFRF